MKSVLAFDLGASSGRGVLSQYSKNEITMTEVNRFNGYTIEKNNHLYWDFPLIIQEIENGLVKAESISDYESVAINTWGVDFGLLDKKGNLIDNPFHYRDTWTKGSLEKMKEIIDPLELYQRTGIQIMEINTLFQLIVLKREYPHIYNRADKLLLIPDLINFYLTGNQFSERTIASTSQLYNPTTENWDYELMEKVGIKSSLFSKIIDPGTKVGKIKKSLTDKLNISEKNVISVASHDTASAVAFIPSERKKNLFLSSGTWSLLGTTLDKPILTEKSYKLNMANETGINNKITFLKNITGLWLLQETLRQFEKEGRSYTYSELASIVSKTKSINCYFDTDLTELTVPGNIPMRIKIFAKKSGQDIPETDGEIIRTIYENLALKYRESYEEILECTNISFENIYIVGGGAKAEFLSQCTANVLNMKVLTGFTEATALGNSIVQFETLGIAERKDSLDAFIERVFTNNEFIPEEVDLWEQKYQKYTKVLKEQH